MSKRVSSPSQAFLGLAAAAAILAGCAGAAPGWTYYPVATPNAAPTDTGSAAPATLPPAGGGGLTLVAVAVAFDTKTLETPAGTAFTIAFDNEDAGVQHNVEIKDGSGKAVFTGDIVTGVASVAYQVPALAAGTYSYVCVVHPIPAMTGTLTVK